MKEKEAFQDNFNNILVCPNNGCMNIPDIIYTYDPLNPTVQYRCSSHNKESEEKMNLSLFLRNCSQNFICAFCQLELNYDNTNFYCKQCKNIIDFSCVNNHNYTFRQHEIFVINPNILYNNCLNHNNPYIFRCLNCNESLCYLCDLNHHNYEGHELKQLISISKNQNERDKICSDFDKQQNYLNKIKEMNNQIIESLENDIMIKKKIIENYKNNKFNYQSIKNFNQLKLKNNEKYEEMLKNIIDKYDEMKKNRNTKYDKELLISQILSPLYYSLMINSNEEFNDSLIDILQSKINKNNNNNIKSNSNSNSNSIIKKIDINENSQNPLNEKNKKKKKINNRKVNDGIMSLNECSEIVAFHQILEKEDPYKEIKTIQMEKSINNMIILHTGNIAASSIGYVYIYDANNLSSCNENNCLLQKITFEKKKTIKYIFEFPDETLLCATYSKIYRLKLTENDSKYILLGYIQLGKSELPTKLISLGNKFLVSLSEQKKLCNLKVFLKKKESNINSSFNNNYDYKYEQKDINDNDSSFDNWSENIQKSSPNKDKDKDKFDSEFELCVKGNVNEDKKLLCSIFELSKKNNNNKNLYEFIATSNYVYDLGDNRIEFYEVKQLNYLNSESLHISRTKKIENISCSSEANSICQINDQYICVGLQNFDLKGQISGFALVDIYQKEVTQIINDNEIYCLNFIKEKNLLISAMEVRDKKGNYNMIKMYKLTENNEKKIEFNRIYQSKSKHTEIIVSVFDLKSLDCAPIAQDNNSIEKVNNSKIIFATASTDSTIRVIESEI